MTVEVPEPEEIEPEPPLPCLVTPEPPPPDVDHVAVEVPAGAEPGSVVEVAHADGRTVDVVVPMAEERLHPGANLLVAIADCQLLCTKMAGGEREAPHQEAPRREARGTRGAREE